MTKLKGLQHTRWFKNTDEVEFVMMCTLTAEQRIMIQTYITLGQRPDGKGCWSCSPGIMRVLTGDMDAFEDAVDAGMAKWPWPEESDIV